jgi:hypothetical protein
MPAVYVPKTGNSHSAAALGIQHGQFAIGISCCRCDCCSPANDKGGIAARQLCVPPKLFLKYAEARVEKYAIPFDYKFKLAI